jgi:hypothetical protein
MRQSWIWRPPTAPRDTRRIHWYPPNCSCVRRQEEGLNFLYGRAHCARVSASDPMGAEEGRSRRGRILGWYVNDDGGGGSLPLLSSSSGGAAPPPGLPPSKAAAIANCKKRGTPTLGKFPKGLLRKPFPPGGIGCGQVSSTSTWGMPILPWWPVLRGGWRRPRGAPWGGEETSTAEHDDGEEM